MEESEVLWFGVVHQLTRLETAALGIEGVKEDDWW